jgi:hypothetical protein
MSPKNVRWGRPDKNQHLMMNIGGIKVAAYVSDVQIVIQDKRLKIL